MAAVWQLQLLMLVGHQLHILAAESEYDTEPSLSHSLTTPLVKVEGDDALLTCVVQNQQNLTLMWKKSIKDKIGTKILTANTARVTGDNRVSIIHEDGGQVYVLLIRNVTLRDAGVYICELNSPVVTRSFHELKIISDRLLAPVVASDHEDKDDQDDKDNDKEVTSRDSIDVWNYSTERPINHDYSDCCISKNVTKKCLGFCHIKNILDGNTGTNPMECEEDFPNIVTCMADGRDHLPCCIDQGIPQACSDLCRGEYTAQSDNIKSLFSCALYTAPTLACIAVGVETLPKQPQGFSVESVNDTAVRVSWVPSDRNEKFTENYQINITYLQFLSPVFSVKVDTETAKKIYPPHSKQYKVPRGKSELVIGNLEIFSLYEVDMWSENKFGKSLSTYSVKVVTHLKGESADPEPSEDDDDHPQIPDIKSCCVANNVSHATCIDKFCDPRNVGTAELTDMMICAPWDTEMFSCLAGGKNHQPCCQRTGVPPLCQELCTGNVTDINFKYFHCLSYMSQLSRKLDCLLEGYEVLPSSPVNFRFSNLETSYGILHWDAPEVRGDTVQHYAITYEQLTPTHAKPKTVEKAKSPFILENLESGSTYEVYVAGVNSAGVGESSTRIVFRTASKGIDDLIETSHHPYNQTECCVKSGVRPDCMPLCNYDASVTQVKALSGVCADDMSKMIRCSAGGRDHLPCCARRGVPKQCQPLCQAVHQQSTGADFQQCLPNIGQIVLCFEEGTINLPAPVKNLRAVSVSNGSAILTWIPGDNADSDDEEVKLLATVPSVQYEIYYKSVGENSSSATVFESDNQVNSTAPIIKINNLTVGGIYKFYVVSRNENGTSLPSSILTLNVSESAWNGVTVKGSTSPPHLLELESHSATWLKFVWNPPAISHPEDSLKYRLYYRKVSTNMSNFYTVETDVTSVQLKDLTPNTQYALYTTAIVVTNTSKVESTPSETLIAWTDPAFPAFVEAPTIHPIDQVLEGSSMKVLCIAMGTPSPHVTLYLNGHPLRTEVTRHMVTNIHNVTRDMEHVSCYADNGYGTPMIASRKITIARAPTVISSVQSGSAPALVGDTAVVSCKVDAWPAPHLAIFTDKELQHTVSNVPNKIDITAGSDEEDPTVFFLNMEIMKVDMDDARTYYCHANNSLGDAVVPVNLQVTATPPAVIDVTQCCRDNNVSARCVDICSFSLDYDLMVARPECLSEFHAMMKCASDGSDHRHCCDQGGVPGHCLDWCRGDPVEDEETCAISHSLTITSCFHQGRTNLPGLPANVKVRPIDAHSAMVYWDLPEKNPASVDLYRVFWRPVGSRTANKTDSIKRRVVLTELTPGLAYEVVVKAGNSNGTSQLTTPLKFVTADQFIIASPAQSGDVGGAVGIVFAVLIVIGLVIVVLYFLKKKNLIVLSVKKPESPTVSFENPFYTSTARDTTASNFQTMSGEEYNVHISSSGSWQSEMSTSDRSSPSSSGSSSSASLAAPAESNTHQIDTEMTSEESPSVYQQIQMGLTGNNGFRRFK